MEDMILFEPEGEKNIHTTTDRPLGRPPAAIAAGVQFTEVTSSRCSSRRWRAVCDGDNSTSAYGPRLRGRYGDGIGDR
jgi:hypothetical protein